MIGIHPKLTSKILEHFDEFPRRKSGVYSTYDAVNLALGKNAKISFTPQFFYTYAISLGDFNLAFQNFKKYHENFIKKSIEKAKKAWPYLQAKAHNHLYKINPKNYEKWSVALTFLSKGSTLSNSSAKFIINKSNDKFFSENLRLDEKYAPLVPAKPGSMLLAMKFPFKRLPPPTQQELLKFIFKSINQGNDFNRNTNYKKALRYVETIESTQHSFKIIDFFLKKSMTYDTKNKYDDYIQRFGINGFKQLIKIALTSNDDDVSVRACKIIATNSILAKPVVGDLKILLEKKKHFTVKIAAIRALAKIGDSSSIPLIKKYLKNRNKLLARVAKQALLILQPVDKSELYLK
jgi:HEAT repeats